NKAGQLPAGDPAGLAIRDKSNLVLGTILFESGNFEAARQSLDRVHLDGPFSNQALLRAGSAEATAQHYDRALVPWNILVEREPTDAAVQEAMLAGLPDGPETYFLMELMSSHTFQTTLHKYLDLGDLQSRLMAWKTSLDAFDDIIRLRQENYEPLLPEVDVQFRELASRIRLRLEQR